MEIVGPTFWGTPKKYQRLRLESMLELDILGNLFSLLFPICVSIQKQQLLSTLSCFVGIVSILKYQ